ncbi:CBS domain-containing protein [Streptomyces mashuensis]|nr:CBS domain-containing protein [Streptomyces mashuensis]
MTTAKDIMHPGAQWVTKDDSLLRVAELMKQMDLGALPVADENERLCGIITDRDIVVKCVARGHNVADCRAADICEGTPRWIDANADVEEVLHEMEQHRIKRLPVIEKKRLIGMISEADLAQHLTDDQIAEFAEAVYARP